MAVSPPASAALVTALKWKSESTGLYTTIVGKLTMQLREDGRAALVPPTPFVFFDRLAPDTRWVVEASELMPWTATRSFIAYGGPLRFTLHLAPPELAFSVSTAAGTAGVSMSSDERLGFARSRPSRGSDGVLCIPDDIDGRYFVAAPRSQQFASLGGDETFTLELAGFTARRALPRMVVEVTVDVAGKRRSLVLTPDLIVIDSADKRVSIVSRAVVRGEATLVRHSLLPSPALASADFGDTPPALQRAPAAWSSLDAPSETAVLDAEEVHRMSLGAGDETCDVSATELSRMQVAGPRGALAVPYALDTATPVSTHRGAALPATPFDPGFAPSPVVPSAGVAATLSPDEDLARQLDEMRRALRNEGQPQRISEKTAPDPPQTARIAPPKPGAMAKPRFKRK